MSTKWQVVKDAIDKAVAEDRVVTIDAPIPIEVEGTIHGRELRGCLVTGEGRTLVIYPPPHRISRSPG